MNARTTHRTFLAIAPLAALLVGTPPASAQDSWPELKLGTNTLRNVTVVQANPVEVVFKHEKGYQRVKRQDLPPEQSARFPYDATRAETYTKRLALTRQLDVVQAREASARGRIQALEVEQEKIRDSMRRYRAKKGTADKGRIDLFTHDINTLEKQKITIQNELNLATQQRSELQFQMAALPELPPEPTPTVAVPAASPPAATETAPTSEPKPAAKKKKKK